MIAIVVLAGIIGIIMTMAAVDLARWGNHPITDQYWMAAATLIGALVALIYVIAAG